MISSHRCLLPAFVILNALLHVQAVPKYQPNGKDIERISLNEVMKRKSSSDWFDFDASKPFKQNSRKDILLSNGNKVKKSSFRRNLNYNDDYNTGDDNNNNNDNYAKINDDYFQNADDAVEGEAYDAVYDDEDDYEYASSGNTYVDSKTTYNHGIYADPYLEYDMLDQAFRMLGTYGVVVSPFAFCASFWTRFN